jgi:hypothetical protein
MYFILFELTSRMIIRNFCLRDSDEQICCGFPFTLQASMEQLKLMGPIILTGILKFLDGQAAAGPGLSDALIEH